MIKRFNRILWTSFFVSWGFDYFFWDKPVGISFALFVSITLIAGLILAIGEGLKPARNSLWLLVPIAFFTVMSFIRLEPMTSFLNRVVTLMLMAIMAHNFLGGRWLSYNYSDYFVGLIKLTGSAITRQVTVYSALRKNGDDQEIDTFSLKKLFPILRGFVIAIPILTIFASLFASADPVFSKGLEDFLDIFNIENLGEYIFRGVYILCLAYLLVGIYLHILLQSKDEKLYAEEKPWLTSFLGFTESTVVLGSVNLLFATFVAIQFRYFFGGEENIHLAGYTYSEYARRGFGELLTVAFFSLLLFMGVSVITRRDSDRKRKLFSGLGIALVAQVGVILASAYQRLYLYENAFGFTRLRLYSHVFMVWLGLLLASMVVLELLGRQRSFALSTLLSAIFFVASLNILNVDALIVRQNINRSRAGEHLDIPYIASLSEDIVPTLVLILATPDNFGQDSENVITAIGASLACHAAINNEYRSDHLSWQSFHLSRARATSDWHTIRGKLESQNLVARLDENEGWIVLVDNEEQPCVDYYYWD
jgi:hypothetical protein